MPLNKLKINSWILTISLFIIACGTKSISNKDFSSTIDPDLQLFFPEFEIEHLNDSISSIHFKIRPDRFLYVKDFNSQKYFGELLATYTVKEELASTVTIDKDSINFSIEGIPGNPNLFEAQINFKAPKGKDYILRLKLEDLKRNYDEEHFIDVFKSNINSSQHYNVSSNTSNPKSDMVFTHFDSVWVTNEKLTSGQLTVYRFKQDFGPAIPPFSVFFDQNLNLEPDSVFQIDNGGLIPTTKEENCFFFVKADTSYENGLLIKRFNTYFPKVKTVNELMYPMEMITTKVEFNNFQRSTNLKLAIDDFWINGCGSRDRARPVIRKFYERVEYANQYFTTYKEGWKTDRGMIYVIYGPPRKLYKSEYSESWIYGEENNTMSLTFNFTKVINPYTNKEFRLERSSVYKNYWYQMIDAWREGRVFTETNLN